VCVCVCVCVLRLLLHEFVLWRVRRNADAAARRQGHVIKNGKSKTTQAVKMVRARHRLLLSGTPIQNNALELWSLFDFLMPGFLGSEKSFNQVYSKPILASRNAKCTSRESEGGALALEALHRQVLPLMLRRTKPKPRNPCSNQRDLLTPKRDLLTPKRDLLTPRCP